MGQLVSNLVDQNILQRILQQSTNQPPARQAPVMPPQPPMMPQQPPVDYLQEQQKQLLMQVLALTPEQIHALPPDQQAQIMALRAQLGQ
jgi:cleavage stimulation factor subunit 2